MRLVFDAGYHTVHHEHPSSHWSSYPELHAARASRILPHLNQSTLLGYCFETYLLGSSRHRSGCAGARGLSETDCDTVDLAK